MSKFTYNPKNSKIGVLTEIDLAKRAGVTQQVARKYRQKHLGPDDWFHDGTGNKVKVWWTEPGIRNFENRLSHPKAGVVIDRIVKDDSETMEIVRANFINKRIIQCRRGNNEMVYVRVRDASKFKPLRPNGQPYRVIVKRDGDSWCAEGRMLMT